MQNIQNMDRSMQNMERNMKYFAFSVTVAYHFDSEFLKSITVQVKTSRINMRRPTQCQCPARKMHWHWLPTHFRDFVETVFRPEAQIPNGSESSRAVQHSSAALRRNDSARKDAQHGKRSDPQALDFKCADFKYGRPPPKCI
jgi:hypothetical protein